MDPGLSRVLARPGRVCLLLRCLAVRCRPRFGRPAGAGGLRLSAVGQGRRSAAPSLHPSPRQGAILAPWTPVFLPLHMLAEPPRRRRRFRSPAGKLLSGRGPVVCRPAPRRQGARTISPSVSRAAGGNPPQHATRMGRSAPPRGLRAGSLDVFVAGRLFRRYAKRDRAGARTAPPQALASRGLSRFVERGRA